MPLHLIAEQTDLLRAVANAVHAVVAQLHVAVQAQQLRLTIAVVHQLPVERLQLPALFLPGGRHRQGGAPAGFPILGLGPGGHQVALDRPPLPLHRGVGGEVIVPAEQRVLLRRQGNEAAVGAPQALLHHGQGQTARIFFQLPAEGRGHDPRVKLAGQVGDPGADLVVVGLLRRVERVVYVHVVADVAELHGRAVRVELVAPPQHIHACRCVRRGLKVLYQLPIPPLHLLKSDAAVGHILKVHGALPLPGSGVEKRAYSFNTLQKPPPYFIT